MYTGAVFTVVVASESFVDVEPTAANGAAVPLAVAEAALEPEAAGELDASVVEVAVAEVDTLGVEVAPAVGLLAGDTPEGVAAGAAHAAARLAPLIRAKARSRVALSRELQM